MTTYCEKLMVDGNHKFLMPNGEKLQTLAVDYREHLGECFNFKTIAGSSFRGIGIVKNNVTVIGLIDMVTKWEDDKPTIKCCNIF